VPGRRSRRERRLRERGRPAWATISAVEDRGGGVWSLALRVRTAEGEPFDARADVAVSDPAGPAVGGRLEVLHDDRRGGRVLAVGEPSSPPAPDPPEVAPAPAPDVGAVLRDLARALGDGSLAQGLPVVVTDAVPPPPADDAPRPLAGLTLDALAARAGAEPQAVVDEAIRRLGGGEATLGEVLAAARRAGLGRADLARLLAARRPPQG
jgi:hypothetical protein